MHKGINFLSKNSYLCLPTSINPKVMLAVDDKFISNNSFQLYYPFSFKAKLMKKFSLFLFLKMNEFMPKVLLTSNKRKSEFIIYLEKKLQRKLVSSVYFSTDKDKVVIQLQSNHKVIGYVKYALNENGKRRLINEQNAIKILSERKIVSPFLLFEQYKNIPFLILKDLNGEINLRTINEIKDILEKLKKEKKYKLENHPRIIQIRKDLEGNDDLSLLLNRIVISSTEYYYEVFEHGDFAPWNIIKTEDGSVPFDFEYFEEYGLEFLDLIKYFYQEGRLLNKYGKTKLVNYIYEKVIIKEIDTLIQIFLLKEIIFKRSNNDPHGFESKLLKMIHEGKI